MNPFVLLGIAFAMSRTRRPSPQKVVFEPPMTFLSLVAMVIAIFALVGIILSPLVIVPAVYALFGG